LVSFLFAFLLPTVPPCLAICKSEGTRAPSPDPYRVGATVCDCFPQNLQSMGWFVVQQGNEQARGAFDWTMASLMGRQSRSFAGGPYSNWWFETSVIGWFWYCSS